ncbi:hypothetical protein [Clostridium lundense]|uniref:hypothetical protein n=1 Tax=Clostridium lundense TaxID=319475 RepID=UPI00048300AB|nr:hypothetical protein [Clostridium lundense]
MNNKKFIRNWEKYRRKGKKIYVLTNSIIMGIAMFVGSIIGTLARGNNYNFDTHLSFFFGGLLGGLIAGLINWPRNEKKYKELINNNLDN